MSDISITFKTELSNQQDIDTKYDGVLLIGTSYDGPVLEIVQVYDMLMMTDIYGSGELVKAYYEAKLSGTDNIYVVRMTGAKASATILSTNDDALIRIESVYAGEKYNLNKLTVSDKKIIIDYNFGNVMNTKTFEATTQSTEEMCELINSYTYLHGCRAVMLKLGHLEIKAATYFMTGGDGEQILTQREREGFLNYTYNIIKHSSRKFSFVVPLMATINDPRINFIGPLNDMCEERSLYTMSTIGVIGAETGNYASMYNKIMSSDMSPYLNTVCIYSRPKINSGFYDFDSMSSGYSTSYISETPEAIFAGMLSVTAKTESIINKVAPIASETLAMTTEEKSILGTFGINTIDYSIGRGYCIKGGKTLAHASELAAINNLRLVLYIQDSIKAITESGIGEDIKLFASKEAEVNIFMNNLTSAKVIKSYNIFTKYIGTDTVEIYGEITPIGSIKAISIDVTMIIKRY